MELETVFKKKVEEIHMRYEEDKIFLKDEIIVSYEA
jgi:hypothetical protein